MELKSYWSQPDITHITFCAVFAAFWLSFREMKNFVFFGNFQQTKLYSFQNLSLRFILKTNFSLDILVKPILIRKKEGVARQ